MEERKDNGVHAGEFEKKEEKVRADETNEPPAEEESVDERRVIEINGGDDAPPKANETPTPTPEESEVAPEPETQEVPAEAPEEESLNDRYLRAVADLDNMRKRAVRDVRNARRHERDAVLRGFLPVMDNIERALDACSDESTSVIEGIEAIRRQLLDTFARFGVEPFDSIGEKFDPHRHEAVATANLADRKEGSIVDVVEVGYQYKDGAVLRPARVIVVRHA